MVQADDVWAADALQPDPRLYLLPRGGATRAHSVLGGLQALRDLGAAEADWVLVSSWFCGCYLLALGAPSLRVFTILCSSIQL